MSAVYSIQRILGPGDRMPWLMVLAGLVALYAPSYWAASQGLWQTDEFGHAPLIIAVVLWLAWQVREAVMAAPRRPAMAAGWGLMALGLLCYAIGRVFTVSSVEFLSQIFVVAAALLLLRGWAALRAAWFVVFFLIFMVPLPGSLIDAITGPLKGWISAIVVDVLHGLGYPIARTGVMITIGQYQLLVADACSGLNSMFSLSALGTLYMYIVGRHSRIHNAVMLFAILPIAFAANIVRVTVLVLVTYHLGDEAGQGFLHGFAGVLLTLSALALFFALDFIMNLLSHSRRAVSSVVAP